MTSCSRWHVPISITSAASPSSPVKVMMDREAEVTTVRLPGVSISISTVFVLYVQLGSLRFAHLFFVNYSALDASIFKISVPIIKRSS